MKVPPQADSSGGRHYEETLRAYGLTDAQYRRAVAAHELAHGVLAAESRTLDVRSVQVQDHPLHGVHGSALIGPRRGQAVDPYEHAVELHAGEIAKGTWLRDCEGVWSREIAEMVHQCGSGDRILIDRLDLDPDQVAQARAEAGHQVEEHRAVLEAGAPQLAERGRLDARRIYRLARTPRRPLLATLRGALTPSAEPETEPQQAPAPADDFDNDIDM